MGRPKKIRDLLTISEASNRYGLNDSTLRLWIRNGKLNHHGKRPVCVRESDLVKLLESLGRPHQPQDETPAPVGDDDPVLDLATVADVLGVKKQTASAYKSEGKLRSYRRSDILAFRDSRQARTKYQPNTALADARTEREIVRLRRERRYDQKEANELYNAQEVDATAITIGRLLTNHRQQGAQRITAIVIRELGETGVILTADHRTTIARAVGIVLDDQGRSISGLLEEMGS